MTPIQKSKRNFIKLSIVAFLFCVGLVGQPTVGIRARDPIDTRLTSGPSRQYNRDVQPKSHEILARNVTLEKHEQPVFHIENHRKRRPSSDLSRENLKIEPSNESGRDSKLNKVIFHLNQTTKLIYLDHLTESGLLIGYIESDNGKTLLGSKEPLSEEPKVKLDKTFDSTNDKGSEDDQTVFSVFFISREQNHLAIALDFDQIDFEPTLNCENQEIRISIIGEINKEDSETTRTKCNCSKANLDDDRHSEDKVVDIERETTDTSHVEDETTNESDETTSSESISEIMAMMMNSPLNKTLLNQSDDNHLKLIDFIVDHLHEETCHEIHEPNKTSVTSGRVSSKKKKNHRDNKLEFKNEQPNPRRRGRSRTRLTSSLGNIDEYNNNKYRCNRESESFKSSMSCKLNNSFRWDEFKIVCGQTKQLIIPMKYFKLSVLSDEFAPDSKFVIRYKILSDASLLPAYDNGKYFCRNRNVIDLDLKCDGYDDCGDASDESVKICGYPSGKENEPSITKVTPRKTSVNPDRQNPKSKNKHEKLATRTNRRRLTYFSADIPQCCQPSDWMNIATDAKPNNMINIPSLIGESMNIFSGPMFAPTKSQGNSANIKRFKRIVGGTVARKGLWPGQASLQYELLEPMSHFCAGTLIHPLYVLTAGHCVSRESFNKGIKVVFGAHDLRQTNNSNIQVRYVDDVLVYPGVDIKMASYDWENDMDNDIALLRLNAPVLVTPHVAPACLPRFNSPLSVNTTCRSIGWGQTHGSGNSNLLKYLSLKVVDDSVCVEALLGRDKDRNHLENPQDGRPQRNSRTKVGRFVTQLETTNTDDYNNMTMICVNNDSGHGICQGDSGGPLYCDRVTESGDICTEVYGVTSFIIQYATVGAMCAVENLPGIFSEVSHKTEWLAASIRMFEQKYRLQHSQ